MMNVYSFQLLLRERSFYAANKLHDIGILEEKLGISIKLKDVLELSARLMSIKFLQIQEKSQYYLFEVSYVNKI